MSETTTSPSPRFSAELEAKRLNAMHDLGLLIEREEEKQKAIDAEVERMTGERKVELQKQTDQENHIDELKDDLVSLAAGKFPERLFPHGSSEIRDTAAEGDEQIRRRKMQEQTDADVAALDAPRRGRKPKAEPAAQETASLDAVRKARGDTVPGGDGLAVQAV